MTGRTPSPLLSEPSVLRALRRAGAGALLALLAGCAGDAPPRVLLALPAATPGTLPATEPLPGQPVLAVRRVAIPEYLEARRVRFRADASTLREWPNTYWAERIEVAVTREFVAALVPQVPGWTVCNASCGSALPDLSVQIELTPLDFVRAERRLQAHARVTVATAGGAEQAAAAVGAASGAQAARPTGLQTRELSFDIAATADTPQAQAEAITALLRQLAAQVAPMVARTRSPRLP